MRVIGERGVRGREETGEGAVEVADGDWEGKEEDKEKEREDSSLLLSDPPEREIRGREEKGEREEGRKEEKRRRISAISKPVFSSILRR